MFYNEKLPKSIHSKKVFKVKCDDCGKDFERRYSYLCRNEKHRCRGCTAIHTGSLLKNKKRPAEVIERCKKTKAETWAKRYPKIELNCKCCQKKFVVPYGSRDRIYCGRSCQSKSIIKTDIRKISECIICKKEFKHYGERILCGRKCNAKYLSLTRIGENNPAFKQESELENRTCLNCGKKFHYSKSGVHKDQVRVFCSLACMHKIDLKGIPQSGLVKQYPFGWNKMLKNNVKERDFFQCQLCGEEEKNSEISHHIHHIDYDKNNLDSNNLITLCRSCHNMTHNGRTFWEIIFSGLISGSQIVKKSWGAEIHIVNHNDYCLKYLIFFKGKQFSHHYHSLKKELWHCVYGKFECVLEKNSLKEYSIFEQGDKIEIEPNVIHQLQAIRNSILVEVSTRSYNEDSIKKIEGIND